MAEPRAQKSHWITEVVVPMTQAKERVARTLNDLPVDVTPGARQVAMVTMFRSAQAEYIDPIVTALRELEALQDWTGGHLVIDKISRTWRDAPFKHWKSFEDFYNQELAETWGKWSDLQETYRLRVGKEISDAQALARVQASRDARELAQDDGIEPARLKAGRPTKEEENRDNIRIFPDGSTTAARIVARLKRDRPDIAQRLARGEFKSASAAARAAGWKVGQSPLQALRSQWKKASDEERQSFLKEINGPAH